VGKLIKKQKGIVEWFAIVIISLGCILTGIGAIADVATIIGISIELGSHLKEQSARKKQEQQAKLADIAEQNSPKQQSVNRPVCRGRANSSV
jgi:hypothetical protein